MAALLLLILVGCTTVNLTPYRELNFVPTTDVQVLRGEPTGAYVTLGEMWVRANASDGILKMREKAMEIGADAIIVVGERNAGAVALPLQVAPGGAIAVPINRTYAVAIRYER